MNQYEDMSLVYDQLTQDQPYHSWFNIVEHFLPSDSHDLLDIGCGTGNLTQLLTSLGEVTGMDISVDMLSIASQKTNQVKWIEGNMTHFNLNKKFNMITIFCDSLNYLETLNDVKMTFERVYQHLNKNGVFIFDVHTVHKMKTLFNNKSYIDESDNVFVGWDAICGDEPLSVYHEMTFFVSQQNGLYRRFDESHYQRTYDEQIYRNLLKDVGYHSVKTFTDFNIHSHEEDAHRLFFVAKK
ncbi:class I SAM-dependent methyltransferase [Staphylococcus epidermidis]|uniref:class I SAM-dependent DNA methyltransferase n=2 Tax=Staphylococcus epidermidis TaxID=1282 RepID=UPI00029942BC|nr:class I SAM-dependent methyltransferase [Staphylococcus epidermidis]ATQ49672.1 class I SAM-dependent methyltransferase [Staphylococcus epidermidis]EKS39382.1 hypothetical protein HMPREF9281_00872 [Staphylococcus epidermidis BVS058A4]MCG1449112.1 class I SAM-dependent methyltransferase [Staphylococcus epidermidis]TIC93320.1 methyltransferase domain protein [Staphylococcus epidermidis VCU112]